jgi:ubiquitin carboxyl-terminal hydrolase 4/11/15
MVWAKQAPETIFKKVQNCKKYNPDEGKEDEESKEGELTLIDCLHEFKKTEMLDEDNKWYCRNCKDHVQATKQLEIYRAPPVMVVSLKRFKTGK